MGKERGRVKMTALSHDRGSSESHNQMEENAKENGIEMKRMSWGIWLRNGSNERTQFNDDANMRKKRRQDMDAEQKKKRVKWPIQKVSSRTWRIKLRGMLSAWLQELKVVEFDDEDYFLERIMLMRDFMKISWIIKGV